MSFVMHAVKLFLKNVEQEYRHNEHKMPLHIQVGSAYLIMHVFGAYFNVDMRKRQEQDTGCNISKPRATSQTMS